MGWLQKKINISSPIARYRLRRILLISIAWTVIDLFLYFRNVSSGSDIDYPYHENGLDGLLASVVDRFTGQSFHVVVVIEGIEDRVPQHDIADRMADKSFFVVTDRDGCHVFLFSFCIFLSSKT